MSFYSQDIEKRVNNFLCFMVNFNVNSCKKPLEKNEQIYKSSIR